MKIAIFDLDETLWDGIQLYKDSLDILQSLFDKNITLYLASYHLEAPDVCNKLGIYGFFKKIYYGRPKSKYEMFIKIKEENPQIDESEMVFFDDNMSNIQDIQNNTCVKTIHVINGIKWLDVDSVLFCSRSNLQPAHLQTNLQTIYIPDFFNSDVFYIRSEFKAGRFICEDFIN